MGQGSSEHSSSKQRSEAEALVSPSVSCVVFCISWRCCHRSCCIFERPLFVFCDGVLLFCCGCCVSNPACFGVKPRLTSWTNDIWLRLDLWRGADEIVSGRRFSVHESQLPTAYCYFCPYHVWFCKTSGVRVGPTLAAHCGEVLLDDIAPLLSPMSAFFRRPVRVKCCPSARVAVVPWDIMSPHVAKEAAANRTAHVLRGAAMNHPLRPPSCGSTEGKCQCYPPFLPLRPISPVLLPHGAPHDTPVLFVLLAHFILPAKL